LTKCLCDIDSIDYIELKEKVQVTKFQRDFMFNNNKSNKRNNVMPV
jgi:hypothetical protein